MSAVEWKMRDIYEKILIYGSDEEVTRIRGMIKAVEDKRIL